MKKIKKLTKESTDELEKELLKHKIETEKEQLRRYLEVLVEYDFADTAASGIYFDELYHASLKRVLEQIDKLPKADREKYSTFEYFFKSGVEDLEFYKIINSIAKMRLDGLDHEQKMNIVLRAIDKSYLWTTEFNRESEVNIKFKELNDVSAPAPVKKGRGRPRKSEK